MDARDAILARARDAISRSQRGAPGPVPRDYVRVGADAPGSEPVVADMVEKLEDYDAVVSVAATDTEVADAIDELKSATSGALPASGMASHSTPWMVSLAVTWT